MSDVRRNRILVWVREGEREKGKGVREGLYLIVSPLFFIGFRAVAYVYNYFLCR